MPREQEEETELLPNALSLLPSRKASVKSEGEITTLAISLQQPWASLLAMGHCHWVGLSWKTDYRGKLVICSTKKVSGAALARYINIATYLGIDLDEHSWESLPRGKAIAVCDLVECLLITPELITQPSHQELDCGDWQLGHYAWRLENVQPIEPIPVSS